MSMYGSDIAKKYYAYKSEVRLHHDSSTGELISRIDINSPAFQVYVYLEIYASIQLQCRVLLPIEIAGSRDRW